MICHGIKSSHLLPLNNSRPTSARCLHNGFCISEEGFISYLYIILTHFYSSYSVVSGLEGGI